MNQLYPNPTGPQPLRPSGSSGGPSDRYDFLFPDLRGNPWWPLGSTDEQRIGHIRSRSEALFTRATLDGTLPAAYTFLGQFVTHDLAFDVRTDLADTGTQIANYRTPRFDLEAVYGAGPRRQPGLYQIADSRKLAIGRNASGEPDLPRSDDASLDHPATTEMNRRRTALIGDPRNDENIVVAQLHLAFLRFHNRLVEDGHDFEQARRLTRLHYQWILLHEYLSVLCTRAEITRVLRAPDARRIFPRTRAAFVPFEFAFAAFRFGHSMVGASYHLSDALERSRGGFALDFYVWNAQDWPSRDAYAAVTLDGERVLPPRWTVQWDRFLGDPPQAQRAQCIDARLAPPLRFLPITVTEPIEREIAFRTLLRGWHLKLPSGQSVARKLGVKWIPSEYPNDDPLFVYILREAEVASRAGRHLGPVGERIVAEVCVRLLEADPNSLPHQRGWTPPLAQRGHFTLKDFLEYARMPITRAEWQRVVGEEDGA